MRRIALFASISALLLAMLPLGPVQAAGPADQGSVPGSYIVVLSDGEPGAVAAEHSRRHTADVTHVYRHALRGYAARMSERAAANVARDPRVAYVEADGVVTASATQSGATWGLDRIDQRAGTNGLYSYVTTGAGVHAYVIDTGIRLTHQEFAGRIGNGTDKVTAGGNANDCNGHGTHVAGTIGGTTYGVAKSVILHPVRVLSCSGSGSWSGVLGGMDWVTANRVRPAVANMSLGGGASQAIDDAVQRMITAGVTVVVAAGNGNQGGKEQPACNYSPARAPNAITIGATTSTDAKTSWSNYGSCVDFFAPGAGITSAWYTGDTATNTISGTSMAAPHAAGAAALFLQQNTSASPAAVRDDLYARTTKDVVTASSTPNNDLLYTGSDEGVPDTNTPPTAGFSSDCTNLGCSFTDTSSDPGGSIAGRSWSFGDGTGSTATNPSHTYTSAGTYPVTLTVTDDGGLTDEITQQVTVTATSEPPTGVNLSAVGVKVKGVRQARLTWSGAEGTGVELFRDGSSRGVIANLSPYTDNIGGKGGGTFTYKVCETAVASPRCSNEAVATF